jgi:AraC-like DNA-binding protein
MDLLHDLLKHTGLQSRLLGHRSFHTPMALEFPCSRSIGFHVVTSGIAFIHTSHKTIRLERGDIALMARGQNHIVSSEESLPKKLTSLKEFEKNPPSKGTPRLTLVSGAYQFWNEPLHPLFMELPDWYVLKREALRPLDKLSLMLTLLSDEIQSQELGRERVIEGILDVMFSLIMRELVHSRAQKSESWSQASLDPSIRLALECMHQDLEYNWSLEELAHKAGMSRANFALKFKKTMGQTPLTYLTILRIQSARDLLSRTDFSVETIAQKLGYQDPFAFSKAFKRLTQQSPRDFRRMDQESKGAEWRFR